MTIDRDRASIESLGVPIGQGRTAEIFAWGDGRVLRLFRPGASRTWAVRELRVARAVRQAGIAAPEVFPADSEDGLIEVDGRFGFVMERIDGPSMIDAMSRAPWCIRRYAESFAALHRSIHAAASTELPSQRERFHRVIDGVADLLAPEIVERLHAAVDAMPHERAICHGDFHPDNVLMSPRGPVIIDWGPATAGCPAADVAWTVYLAKHGGAPVGASFAVRAMLALFRRLFLALYRRAYVRDAAFDWREVERVEPVIAAVRLGDGIPEERKLLLDILHRRSRRV